METDPKEPLFFMVSVVLTFCILMVWDEFKNNRK
jgi:hypothetical protein